MDKNDNVAPVPGDEVLFPEDYQRVQAILRGENDANRWFDDTYGNRILQTALSWCRPNCWRGDCRLKVRRWGRLLDWIFGNDCDEIQDAYVFLLGEVKGRVLRGYRGRASLRTFLHPIFNRTPRKDANRAGCNYRNLFASYMVSKHGKYVPPKWVAGLRSFDQSVHRECAYGRDSRQIAYRLKCELAEVEESRHRIGEAARATSPDTHWSWLLLLEGGEVSLAQPVGHDDEEMTIEDLIPNASPPVDQSAGMEEARRILSAALRRLADEDLVLLYMRCGRRLTGEQTAAELGLSLKAVYEQEKRALESFNAHLADLSPDYKALETNELREALKSYYER